MNASYHNYPVSKNIRKIIHDNGLKQKFIAEKSGFEPDTFGAMLNDRRIIKSSDIPKIAKALKVKPGDLFNDEHDEEKPA